MTKVEQQTACGDSNLIIARPGLTAQSLTAALLAAYVGVLVSFITFAIERAKTGVDASICLAEPTTHFDWCGLGESLLAFALIPIRSLFGMPVALLLTTPIALLIGRLAPPIEKRFDKRSIAYFEFGIGVYVGIFAGMIIGNLVAGLAAAIVGVWIFRRNRYDPVPRKPNL